MSNSKRVVATLALALVPALAAAWTPYAYDPYQPGVPDSVGTDAFGPGPANEFGPMGPMGRSGQMGPMGPMGPMEPSDAMGPPPPMTQRGSMRIQQSATEQAYLLNIQLSGVKPADVKVEARGPWILVTRDTSAEATQQETFNDGRGYRRSFSYSSGRASRRFNVPRDGDTSAMQRQDTEDAIRITIPRTNSPLGTTLRNRPRRPSLASSATGRRTCPPTGPHPPPFASGLPQRLEPAGRNAQRKMPM